MGTDLSSALRPLANTAERRDRTTAPTPSGRYAVWAPNKNYSVTPNLLFSRHETRRCTPHQPQLSMLRLVAHLSLLTGAVAAFQSRASSVRWAAPAVPTIASRAPPCRPAVLDAVNVKPSNLVTTAEPGAPPVRAATSTTTFASNTDGRNRPSRRIPLLGALGAVGFGTTKPASARSAPISLSTTDSDDGLLHNWLILCGTCNAAI